MSKHYTRQRQGRDFSDTETKTKSIAVQSDADAARREVERLKSLRDRLSQLKEETERNAVPIDGEEPTQDCPASEKGR